MYINVDLEPDLIKEIEIISQKEKINTDNIFSKAMENYIFNYKVNNLRGNLSGFAEKAGINDEEELLQTKL